jgi:hypothetical protein
MIPIDHGPPNLHLTPWARMWRTQKGNYHAALGDSRVLISEVGGGDYGLHVVSGDRFLPVARLDKKRDLRTGGVYLEGRWGLMTVLARHNPACLSTPVTLYCATRSPCPWIHSLGDFDP